MWDKGEYYEGAFIFLQVIADLFGTDVQKYKQMSQYDINDAIKLLVFLKNQKKEEIVFRAILKNNKKDRESENSINLVSNLK